MLEILKRLFRKGSPTDYAQLAKKGAVILDVRSRAEFESGHVNGAINIPLDQLQANMGRLKDKNKPIITCCASGMRSASAKAMLRSKGYAEVYNAGSWTNLKNKISF